VAPCVRSSRILGIAIGLAWASIVQPTRAQSFDIPILVPLTGFLSLEGQSQRDGALLALAHSPSGIATRRQVFDTATSPEVAVNALEKALEDKPLAIVASMLGTQMLAMLPIAQDAKVPLVTISGTAKITELGNPWVFRFFPGDGVVKVAHARYVAEILGKQHPVIIYQSDAYGQSGLDHLAKAFAERGVTPVLSEGVDVAVKDLLPVLSKARAAGADVIVAHLHAPSTALLIKQAASGGGGLPIVAGSAMATPATAALLEPAELMGVCAESASAPNAADTPAGERFLADYRAAFHADPDTYALAQYDGTMMVLDEIAKGARSSEALREALATESYEGVAMVYKSDGAGNMAHSAIIVCYDGTSRLPKIVRRYDDVDAAR
jgi:branched-chain amino acid transport system substrate-binding protein